MNPDNEHFSAAGRTPALPESAPVAAPGRVDWPAKLRQHKIAVIALLALLLVGSVSLWAYLTYQQETSADPTLAGSDQVLDSTLPAPVIPAEKAPTDALEARARAEEASRLDDPNASDPNLLMKQNMLASGAMRDTTGDAEQRRQAREEARYVRENQQKARADMARIARQHYTDSVLVTRRNASTGQYTQQRVAVQRSPRASSNNGGFVGGGSSYAPSSQPREKAAPLYDRDGTPFETNDAINGYLSAASVDVQKAYEKMSGRRYRPRADFIARDEKARAAMEYLPGMDGFNTVKYRGATIDPNDNLEAILTPDVFYRCLIDGNQVVRTGSIVMLRLSEDASIGGVVFPRNMIFAAVATVETNRVAFAIDRLGPHRVACQIYNYNYMPGIMIDPSRRPPAEGNQSMGGSMQNSSTQELSTAIAQSQQAANSWQGIAGRMGVSMINNLPRPTRRLRDVTLPDGYPVLLTTAQGAAGTSAPTRTTAGGLNGQGENPMQSLFMEGRGIGGYPGNSPR